MPTLAATDLRPRRLVIEHVSIEIEGRTLEDVQLGGWVYGPELGTAPVVLIVGGIAMIVVPALLQAAGWQLAGYGICLVSAIMWAAYTIEARRPIKKREFRMGV